MLKPSAELAVTSPATLFAALDDGQAHVFSFPERRRLASFPTVHAMGGRRAALVPGEPPLLLVAAWLDHGVAAYEAHTGTLVWQRKDLNHVQHLVFLGGEPGKPIAALAREDGIGWALNALNGKSVASLRMVRQLYAAPALSKFLAVERSLATLRDASSWSALAGPPLFKVPGTSLVLLDAALTTRQAVFSRPAGDFGAGGLEARSLQGAKRWSFPSGAKSQFNHVVATPTGYLAVERNLADASQQLVEVSEEGKLVRQRELREGFTPTPFDEGRVLLTPDGRALDAERLAPVWAFGDEVR